MTNQTTDHPRLYPYTAAEVYERTAEIHRVSKWASDGSVYSTEKVGVFWVPIEATGRLNIGYETYLMATPHPDLADIRVIHP